MKTKLIAGMAILLGAALAGCSDHSDPAPTPADGAIRFAAQSADLSRAVTTTENLTEFGVYAYTEGQPFMKNVAVTKNSSNEWVYSPTQYWPLTPVNFYAFAPLYWNEEGDNATPVQPDEPVDYYSHYGNTDLIYSVLTDQTQTAGPVTFNFRHALSQVNVALRTDNEARLAIKVSEVVLVNVNTSGTFTFPTSSTTAGGSTKGSWSNLSGQGTYIFNMAMDDASTMTLTSDAQNANLISQGLIVPQPLQALSLTNTAASGEYFMVDLIIYDKTTGKQVWPNDQTPPVMNINDVNETTGRLFFPVLAPNVTAWEPGTRYLYTITINEPTGLQEIEFGQPAVDTYTEVSVDIEPGSVE